MVEDKALIYCKEILICTQNEEKCSLDWLQLSPWVFKSDKAMEIDIARDGQAYMDSGVACRIICQFSTRSRLRFNHMVLKDRARKPSMPSFIRDG